MPEWARPLPGEEGGAPIGASGEAGGASPQTGEVGAEPTGARSTPARAAGAHRAGGAAAGSTSGGRASGRGGFASRGSFGGGSSGFGSGSSGRSRSGGGGFGSSGLSGGFGERSSKRSAGGSRRKEYSGERKERTPRPTVADRVESGALAGAELTEHAREAILRTLTAAPKSRRQLMDSMTRKGYPPEVLEPILDRSEERRVGKECPV